MYSTIANLLAVVAFAVTPVLADTVHGVVIYTRHGDRTAKFYKGYHLTNLGAEQLQASGLFYRDRYIKNGASRQILGISPDQYKESQVYGSAPDQTILLQTGANFFEGIYPPLNDLNTQLTKEPLKNNGSAANAPMNGYQYIHIHGETPADPDTIWIKGDEVCPAYTTASTSYEKSNEYVATLASSSEFYKQFDDLLKDIMPAGNVSYAHAFDVFDLLNVANIHNLTVNVPTDRLAQLRYYSDASESARNYNRSMPDRAIGGMTLMGGFLRQLDQTVTTQGALKLSILAGSYDTFLSFFGLANLTDISGDFRGLPNYASTMTFELFTDNNMTSFPSNISDLRVRFLFMNGTDSALTAYPLFDGKDDSMAYNDFKTAFNTRAINTAADWCTRCKSSSPFCSQNSTTPSKSSTTAATTATNSSSKLTLVQAGVIGAMTTLGVVALLAAILFLVRRKRTSSADAAAPAHHTKRAADSDTESGAGSKH